MPTRLDRSKKRLPPRGGEQAHPRADRSQCITPLDVARTREKSGPVKTWREMTADERAEVLASIKGRT